mmetsp:Transcript_33568/g.94269  ORF Transcript_33568/g.94269 Transcript_33568/m.94269 type:complete len:411 (-) Transcript_33568:152-1384(-)
MQVVALAPLRAAVVVLPLAEDVQERRVVARAMHEALLCRSGGPDLVGVLARRSEPHPLGAEHRHERYGVAGAAQLVRREQAAGELRLQGVLGHPPAELRQLAVGVQGADEEQDAQRLHQAHPVGRLQEVEGHDVVDAHRLHLQGHGCQVRAQDLGHSHLREALQVRLLRVQAEALAVPRPPGAARALLRLHLRDLCHHERLHAGLGVEVLLLAVAAVYDVADVGHGERRLRDVGAEDELPAPLRDLVEDVPLVVGLHHSVQGDDHAVGDLLAAIDQALQLCLRQGDGLLALVHPREEDEDVARALAQVEVERDVHRRLHALRLGDGVVVHVYLEGAPRDLQDRAAVEVGREGARVERGRGDEHPELARAARERALHEGEEHVRAEAALVGLIEDDDIVVIEVRVPQALAQ